MELTNFEGFAFVYLHFVVLWNTIQVLLNFVSPRLVINLKSTPFYFNQISSSETLVNMSKR